MCNQREKLYIHNLNRVVIAFASLFAMLIDGVSTANVLYLGSAIVWLFLPECDAAEEYLLETIKICRERLTGKKQVTEARATTTLQNN